MKAYLVSVQSAEHTLELAAALLDEGVRPEDLSVVVEEGFSSRVSNGDAMGGPPRLEADLIAKPTGREEMDYASTGEIEMDRSYEAANNQRGVIYESEIGGGISTASPDDSVSSIEEMDDASEIAERTLDPLGDFDARNGPPSAMGPDPEDVPENLSRGGSPTGIHGQEGGLGVGVLAALIPAVVPGVGVVMGDGPLASDLLAEEERAMDEGVIPFLRSQGLPDGEAAKFEAALASGGGILEVTAASGEASGRQVLGVLESHNHSRYLVVDVE
jgi:hypothetical protein